MKNITFMDYTVSYKFSRNVIADRYKTIDINSNLWTEAIENWREENLQEYKES